MANLKDRIDAVRREFDEAARRASDARSIEELRTAFLGRKRGHVTLLFEDLKSAPPEDKREAGRSINELKIHVQERIDVAEANVAAKATEGRAAAAGPDLTLFEEEIERVFLGMGFSIEEGPEIETDYYNFEALNFPPYHPARDKWDTLFIKGDLLLRTHTSPVQVRVMERSKPPIRIICPGRVFRRETPDPTHLPMFMQVEGLVIDEGVTFAHLKGTLEYFLRALFGEKVKVRFRPSFFPFTEPSAEVDIECLVCSGRDAACRVCGGTGWKEILGSGMVDPQVLKNVNIDPERYSGWAFGLGIDRTAMFAYGIPEMRYFYENDLRFLRQFGTK
jgi:phenylalanyl-tRNA synthetase alpha chain